MGEVDGHKYPDLDAEEAVEIAEVIVNEYGGEANSEEAFASSIGHSSTSSGTYRSKVADVRKWGVLESRGIEATDLAFRLANPKDDEDEKEARFEMYQNIGILRRLYDHLEGKEPPSEFWRVISELTGADPKTSREAADDLEDLYEEMLEVKPEVGEGTAEPSTQDEAETSEDTQEKPPLRRGTDGIYVEVAGDSLDMGEVNESTLEMARLFIESKKRNYDVTESGGGGSLDESEEDDQQLTLG